MLNYVMCLGKRQDIMILDDEAHVSELSNGAFKGVCFPVSETDKHFIIEYEDGEHVAYTITIAKNVCTAGAAEGICSECGRPADGQWLDLGIGPYEFWGSGGVDVQMAFVSSCCEAPLLESPGGREIDSNERANEEAAARGDAAYDEMRDRELMESYERGMATGNAIVEAVHGKPSE